MMYCHILIPPLQKSPCRKRCSSLLLICEKNKPKDLLWQGNQSELTSGFFYVKSNDPTYYYSILSTLRALYNEFSYPFTIFFNIQALYHTIYTIVLHHSILWISPLNSYPCNLAVYAYPLHCCNTLKTRFKYYG